MILYKEQKTGVPTMYICLCSGYKTSDLKRDIENNKSVKDIILENGIDEGCRKCCSTLKNEYKEMKGDLTYENESVMLYKAVS